jgi:hypothetical protein
MQQNIDLFDGFFKEYFTQCENPSLSDLSEQAANVYGKLNNWILSIVTEHKWYPLPELDEKETKYTSCVWLNHPEIKHTNLNSEASMLYFAVHNKFYNLTDFIIKHIEIQELKKYVLYNTAIRVNNIIDAKRFKAEIKTPSIKAWCKTIQLNYKECFEFIYQDAVSYLNTTNSEEKEWPIISAVKSNRIDILSRIIKDLNYTKADLRQIVAKNPDSILYKEIIYHLYETYDITLQKITSFISDADLELLSFLKQKTNKNILNKIASYVFVNEHTTPNIHDLIENITEDKKYIRYYLYICCDHNPKILETVISHLTYSQARLAFRQSLYTNEIILTLINNNLVDKNHTINILEIINYNKENSRELINKVMGLNQHFSIKYVEKMNIHNFKVFYNALENKRIKDSCEYGTILEFEIDNILDKLPSWFEGHDVALHNKSCILFLRSMCEKNEFSKNKLRKIYERYNNLTFHNEFVEGFIRYIEDKI